MVLPGKGHYERRFGGKGVFSCFFLGVPQFHDVSISFIMRSWVKVAFSYPSYPTLLVG